MPTSRASLGGRSPNLLRWTLELLYEQCSLHMTLYIASSAVVGRRPRICLMRSYSSALSPSSAQGCPSSGLFAAISTVSMLIARFRPRSAPRSLALPAMLARASFSRSCVNDRLQHAGEEAQAVGARAGEVLHGVLGVRHQAD